MIGVVDWDKIKRQAPKSLQLYTDWDVTKSGGMLIVNQRDLFDFFDEKDLIVQIIFEKGKFGFMIKSSYLETDIINNDGFNDRIFAEVKAFENCFYLLEAIFSSDQSKMLSTWN